MSTAIGLDHVAFAVRDLDAASADLAALGFHLTPIAPHTDATGTPTGTANRCAMLGDGYIELIATIDPARPSRTLAGFIERYEGAHILSLTVTDATAAQARLAAAGLSIAIATTARPTPYGIARFERLPLTTTSPRLQLIQHHTPDLVWRPEDITHPNGATALTEVIIASAAPAETAALLCRLAGRPLRPDPAGGFALPLAAGCIRIFAPDVVARVLPGIACPPAPAIAAIVVATTGAGRRGTIGGTTIIVGDRKEALLF